jgi:hypothetical protein
MTQPRKEQINDQRTYYTRVDSVGVTTPIPFGTPDVPGGTVQTIQNTIVENYYNEFLAATITGTPGGAEQDTPAYFYGNSGPFSPPVSSGSTFTITLPGINSGNPVAITFQPSDVFDIGGIPYITTSQVAKRINLALTAAGVSPTSPVAVNSNGQLLLLSANSSGYTYGETAFITVNDLTVGVCTALGLAPSNTATSVGISSPKRGIVTTVMNDTPISPNGPQLGGLVQLLLPDASPAITKSPIQINVGGLGNLPLYPSGQSIIGGLQQFTNTAGNSKFTVQYHRQGAVPGKVVTKGGNFSTLSNTDTFQVTVNTVNPALFGLPGTISADPAIQTYTFTVSFSSTPTGASDVIAAVNTAWNANAVAQGFPAGTEAGRGGVYGNVAGPWQFINGLDQFWIVFNGQNPATNAVNITPPGFNGVVTWTATDLMTFINAQITASAANGQGTASVGPGGTIQITSALTSGPSSTVQIIAGDLNNPFAAPTGPGDLVTTLDKLGISPGVYSGSVIARPYGNAATPEDIVFACPDHTVQDPYGSPSGITITGSSTVMAKLGLSGTTITGNVTIGTEPVTPPIVHALIPEMMYFGEVPENIETSTDRFLTTDEPSPVAPGSGTGNLGTSPLLGLDGKINPDLVRKVFDVLSVDSLTLGARQTGYLQGNEIARVLTPFSASSGSGMTLLWQGVSTAGLTGIGASQIMRLYADYAGGLWLTTNAARFGAATPLQWDKDPGQTGQSASAIYIGQSTTAGVPKVEFLYAPASASNPFIFGGSIGTSANAPVGVDPSGALGGALAFLLAGTASTASNENIIPRLLAQVAPNTFTLVWQTVQVAGTENVRVYSYVSGTSQTEYWLTVNASWTGIAWTKDTSGVNAYALQLQTGNNPGTLPTGIGVQSGLFLYYRAPGDNTPWATWTANGGTTGPNSFAPFSVTGQNGTGGGTLNANNLRLADPGQPNFPDIKARISVPMRPSVPVGAPFRTGRVLVSEFGTGPQGTPTMGVIGANGAATITAVGGGPGSNLATINVPSIVTTGFTASMQGQWVEITGAANSGNNGIFQIANVLSTSSVQYVNPHASLPDANNPNIYWAIGGSGFGQICRIYRGQGFQGNGGFGPQPYDFVAMTVNAAWNNANWIPDLPGIPATMQMWFAAPENQGGVNAGTGYTQFFTVQPSGFTPWVDSDWVCVTSISSNGIEVPHLDDTYNINAIPNLANTATLVKAWGNIIIAPGNPPTFYWYPNGSGSNAIFDSYNLSSISWSSGNPSAVTFTMNAGMDAGNFIVLAKPIASFIVNFPTEDFEVGGVPAASNQFELQFFNFSPASFWGTSGPPTNSLETLEGGAEFIVIGRQ